jgi:fibronectin-binding autotransporter adhesin
MIRTTSRSLVLVAAVLGVAGSAQAATYWWGNTTGVAPANSFGTASLWSTAAATSSAVTPSGVVPGAADDIIIGWDSLGGANAFDVPFNTIQSVNSVRIRSGATPGDPTLHGTSATTGYINFGAGGVTVEARATDTNPHVNTALNNLRTTHNRLTANQTFNIAATSIVNTRGGGGRMATFGPISSTDTTRRVVTLTGTGMLIFSSNTAMPSGTVGNDYDVSNGILAFANNTPNALGTSASSIGNVTLRGAGRLQINNGTLSNVNINIGNGVAGDQTQIINSAGLTTAQINGVIQNNGATSGRVLFNGDFFSGIIILGGSNTYTGGTILRQGSMRIVASERLPDVGQLVMSTVPSATDPYYPTGTGYGPSNAIQTAVQSSTLDLNGFSETIGGLVGFSTASATPTIGLGTDANSTLTINTGGVNAAYQGRLRNQSGGTSGVANDTTSRVLSIVKTGLGTQTLVASTGASPTSYTYSGTTVVNGGKLQVDGFIERTASLTVNNGGTLGGSGTVASPGAVTVNSGGSIAPGSSPGTLTLNATGGLVLNSGSTLDLELDASNQAVGGGINDLIQLTGALTLDGALNVASSPLSAGTWRLINYTGSLTNNTLDIGTVPVASGFFAAIDTATAGQVNLVVAAVPEPTTIATLAAAGMVLLRRRSR